ncbi:MAG: DGQHR domain-containing protein [Erythrobacter sp.]|nr:DGQHR domain-containing protein [Verrucomicrobiales bacterium]MBL4717666.1 DGQHR domain-containing protein [Erythrobacter sp.]
MGETGFEAKAIRFAQGETELFMFTAPGDRIADIADISRVQRKEGGVLGGFQRKDIRGHIADIAEYLGKGDVIFPNPIIIALAPGVRFTAARGPKSMLGNAAAGTLHILGDNARGWIVDGQQRSLALEQSGSKLPVPVIAFVSADIAVHREQFILVNKARPLPRGVVDVLLPSLDAAVLPRDLGPRKIPNVLVDALNQNRNSPFHGLIIRAGEENGGAVVNDQALLKAIKRSISSPLGALAPYGGKGREADIQAMYAILSGFWSAVRTVFPEAWGRSPRESRLMHSAGIETLGFLLDRILGRPDAAADPFAHSIEALERIAPYCRWTEGRWEEIDLEWNEVEYTAKSINRLRDHLIRLEHRPRAAA